MPFSTSQVTVERVCNGLNFGDTPSFINSEKATGVDRQVSIKLAEKNTPYQPVLLRLNFLNLEDML